MNKFLFHAVPIFVDSFGNFIELNWEFIYKGTIRDFYPPVEALPIKNSFQLYAENLGDLNLAEQEQLISKIGYKLTITDLKQKIDFGPVSSEISDSFAPVSPAEWKKNPNEWLSSVDIMKVMKQYEKAYKCFDFIGPSPIDFDTRKMYGECVWEELCNFNLREQIKKGKTKIGVIFNTDPHNKPGQHWISLFMNIKKKHIFFFDSTGDKPPAEVMTLVNRIKEQGMSLKNKIVFKFDSNEGVEHQYGNTECGVYSLFFIVHMLEDKLTEHYLKTHILKDDYMQKFRKIYFNDSL